MEMNEQQLYALRLHLYYEDLARDMEAKIKVLQELKDIEGVTVSEMQLLMHLLHDSELPSETPIPFAQFLQAEEQQYESLVKQMKLNLEREGITLPE